MTLHTLNGSLLQSIAVLFTAVLTFTACASDDTNDSRVKEVTSESTSTIKIYRTNKDDDLQLLSLDSRVTVPVGWTFSKFYAESLAPGDYLIGIMKHRVGDGLPLIGLGERVENTLYVFPTPTGDKLQAIEGMFYNKRQIVELEVSLISKRDVKAEIWRRVTSAFTGPVTAIGKVKVVRRVVYLRDGEIIELKLIED